jgi:hypothetical protein
MKSQTKSPSVRIAAILSFFSVLAGLSVVTLSAIGQPTTAAPESTAKPAAPQANALVDDISQLQGKLPTGPVGPAPRGADGKPDLTGYWKPLKEKGKPGGNIGKDLPDHKLPFTPAGEAALQYNLTKTIDPEALCILGGIPRHDASGLPFEIVHNPKRAVWLYVYTTHRIIPIDPELKHEEDPDPRYFGNSISHWEGDTLVIDTIGFNDSKDGKLWIDENANPQSAQTHVIERWTRVDEKRIQLELWIDDPVYYQHPFTFNRTWVLGKPGEGLREYACNENNLDAAHIGPGPGQIGPDGNRGSGYGTLPANPPPPEFYDTPKATEPAKKP